MRGPNFSENNGPVDQFSRNFGPPDQNFWRTKISVTGPCISAQAHFVECCSPRFWCIANSELCAQFFYYMCHVCMLLSLRVLYMYCRAPYRALSMNLEPSTTESNYLHTCYCVPRVCARPHLRMRISSYVLDSPPPSLVPSLFFARGGEK